MGIKSKITLYKAFLAAGFSLAKLRAVPTDDGACWEATLKKGKVEILRVSNGGYGGPDEVRSLLTSKDELARYIRELYAVPEISVVVREHLVFLLELDKKYAKEGETRDFDAEIEAAKNAPLAPNGDATATVIGCLTEAKETVDRLKRSAKGKILFLEKCEAGDSDEYRWLRAPLTDENRAEVKKRHATLDVFINDLIDGL